MPAVGDKPRSSATHHGALRTQMTLPGTTSSATSAPGRWRAVVRPLTRTRRSLRSRWAVST